MSERWEPEKDGDYFFINFDGHVFATVNDGHDVDLRMIEFGNCFRTRKSAEAAAEKVKKLLLSLHEPNTNSSQLPKLTTEVFDREDCPDWVRYAAVDMNGDAYYFRHKPYINEAKNAWICDSLEPMKYWIFIDRDWDSSDWQNSLIERPVKNPELPEWCKVGEFVYDPNSKVYFKIKMISNEDIVLQDPDNEGVVSTLCTEFFMAQSPIQARLRPYEQEEMYELLGKFVEDDAEVMLITRFDKKDNLVEAGEKCYDAERLFNECTINGNPCGKLEHLNEKGEWIE